MIYYEYILRVPADKTHTPIYKLNKIGDSTDQLMKNQDHHVEKQIKYTTTRLILLI